MADEDTIIGLSLGFVLLAIAFVWGPSIWGLLCGVFGGAIVMMSGLSIFLSKIEHRRGD
jgi:hypothetical protein